MFTAKELIEVNRTQRRLIDRLPYGTKLRFLTQLRDESFANNMIGQLGSSQLPWSTISKGKIK